jgi:hypothetical protein
MAKKLSDTADAIRKRIKALPRLVEGAMLAIRTRDANAMILNWRNGIVSKSFGLAPLKPKTIARKARMGYSAPSTPLYALGFEGPWTYIKALRKYRTKRGWSVRFSARKHHSGMSEEELFELMEYGFNKCPPRPAFTKAYIQTMKGMKDSSEEVLAAAWEFIESGKRQALAKIQARANESEGLIGNPG